MNQKDLKKVSEAAKQIYDYGCYFLSLCYVAKGREPYNIDEMIDWYDLFCVKCWMEEDCYVKDPCAILEFFTGKKYMVKKSSALDTSADIVIGRWHNPTTKHSHFVVMDSNNSVAYDPLGESITTRDGFVESYRLFYECK